MGARRTAGPALSHVVRVRRLQLHLSQRAAADLAGVSLATWQELEREGSTTRFQELTLTRAATALGLPVGEVFAAAGRRGPEVAHAPDSPQGRRASGSASDRLVDELTAQLRSLADRSPQEFMLLHRFVTDFVAHFLDHGKQP